MSFASLRNHSTYSLYKGLSKPVAMAERAIQSGAIAVGITDHRSLAATVKHVKAISSICICGHHKDSHSGDKCGGKRSTCKCTKYEKNQIKSILGCDLSISSDDAPGDLSYLTVLCKNLDGWKNLLKITYESNKQENVYQDMPRISLESFKSLISQGNLIGISGYVGSDLAKTLIHSSEIAYTGDTYKVVRKLVTGEALNETIKKAEELRDIFGRENFYLDTNLINQLPASEVLTNAMRHISEKTGIPCVYSGNSYYPSSKDADDQRILLCSKMDADYDTINRKIALKREWDNLPFFRSESFHIASFDEIKQKHSEKEISHSLLIADMCESYDILGRPLIPEIKGPNGESSDDYLKKICMDGWNKKIKGKIPKDKIPEYQQRIRHELNVMSEAKLSSYFLVVEDYIRYARSVGMITCKGRGCLTFDAPVVMADSSVKKLGHINIGDFVISDDGLSHEVTNKMEYEIEEDLLKIRSFYGDSNGITLTKDHKVLSEKMVRSKKWLDEPKGSLSWVKAEELSVGDWVFTPFIKRDSISNPIFDLSEFSDRYRLLNNGILTQIKSIELVSGINKVYDITVKDTANYLTTSFIVHNSSAGSMIAYLSDITGVDPIEADLLFERFYNAGRNTADRVSLPDIDTDFPSYRREEMFAYIKNKYGLSKTAHMATFSRMQGRKGLSEIFRAKYSSIPFSEVKKITEHVPDEADINDELQVMKESGEDPSIVMWALDNNRKQLRDYCYIDDDGVLQGQYKVAFEQAIRLEGTKTVQSKHASGIVVSSKDLSEFCPMLYDKSTKEQVIGVEMQDAEDLGASKYDILATLFLDKVLAAKSFIRYGKIV